MQKKYLLYLTMGVFLFLSCEDGPSFDKLIIQDVKDQMATGICEDIPAGAEISNIVIGEIIPIKGLGLIDVSISFDYKVKAVEKNFSTTLLYSSEGKTKKLQSIGRCSYKKK